MNLTDDQRDTLARTMVESIRYSMRNGVFLDIPERICLIGRVYGFGEVNLYDVAAVQDKIDTLMAAVYPPKSPEASLWESVKPEKGASPRSLFVYRNNGDDIL